VTPEETTAPAAEREPSPEFVAAIARFDAIDEDDPGNWAAGLAAAALMLLMASADEPGAGVLLAELSDDERDRVADAANELTLAAAPGGVELTVATPAPDAAYRRGATDLAARVTAELGKVRTAHERRELFQAALAYTGAITSVAVALAELTPPVDGPPADPAGLIALVTRYGDARANAEVGAEHAGQAEVDAYAAEAAELLDRIRTAIAALDDTPHHVVEFREDGWTIKHPLTCRPALFDCPVNREAERTFVTPQALGRFAISLTEDGALLLDELVDAQEADRG
jgi:hypothetical protein